MQWPINKCLLDQSNNKTTITYKNIVQFSTEAENKFVRAYGINLGLMGDT